MVDPERQPYVLSCIVEGIRGACCKHLIVGLVREQAVPR